MPSAVRVPLQTEAWAELRETEAYVAVFAGPRQSSTWTFRTRGCSIVSGGGGGEVGLPDVFLCVGRMGWEWEGKGYGFFFVSFR